MESQDGFALITGRGPSLSHFGNAARRGEGGRGRREAPARVVLALRVPLMLETDLAVEVEVLDHLVVLVKPIMVVEVVPVFRHQIHSGIQVILLEHLGPQMVISTLQVVAVVELKLVTPQDHP